MNKQKKVRKHTFTLVELLVVLLILGVLVGLAVPRYMESQKAARARTFAANVRQIVSALEAYRMDTTSDGGPAQYPGALSDLQKKYFTQEPINPYTGKSMLSSTTTDSGLLYQSTGPTYKLCVVQRDIEDVNNNGVVDEVLPLTTKSVCIGDMRSNIQLTFIRPSVAYTSGGTQVGVNVPRFEAGKFGQAIMVEEETTNLANNPTFSGDVGTTPSGWNRDVTIQQDDFFGQLINVAELLCVSGNNYEDFGTDIAYPLAYNTTYTISFWARGTMELTHELETIRGIASATWKSKPPMSLQWQRYEVTIVTASSGPIFPFWWHLQNVNDVNVDKWVRIARIQLEQKPYATSFIDGTRAAEPLTIPTASVLNPQEGTVECWVKLSHLKPNDYNAFFTSGDVYDPGPRILIMRQFAGGYVNKILVWDGDGSSEAILASVTTLQAGIWYYVAFTWSPSGRKLYVNGVLEASKTRSNNMSFATLANIGSWGKEGYLNGLIDDLRISSRARTDAEILSAYQSNQPLPVDAWTTLKADFDGNLDAQSGILP